MTKDGTNNKKVVPAFAVLNSDTSWTNMIQINDKFSANINCLFVDHCIYGYPRPAIVIHYNGTEVTGWVFKIILQTYGIEPNTIDLKIQDIA